MKLNHKITISSIWNEEKQVNETSVDFDQDNTPSELLTVIEMGKRAIYGCLENAKGEIDTIINTKFSEL